MEIFSFKFGNQRGGRGRGRGSRGRSYFFKLRVEEFALWFKLLKFLCTIKREANKERK